MSGDLVWSGENAKIFDSVQKEFIDPILSKLKFSQDKFILTQGNHDNAKDEKELPLVKEHIDRFIKMMKLIILLVRKMINLN